MGEHATGVWDIEVSWTALTDPCHLSKLPWYSAEIEEITPQAQELFEKYSNVDSENVKAHIKELVRNQALLSCFLADCQ